MKRAGIFAVIVLAGFGLCGCNEQQKVLTGLSIAGQVLTIAQDDLPALQAAGTLTPADTIAVNDWINGGQTLLSQATTCVTGLGTTAKGTAIAVCVNTFGQGLLAPAEMQDLRIVSAQAQKKVTLYVTAFILAANAAGIIVNAIQIQTPVVGSTPTPGPSTEELREFRIHAGISAAYGY
jgi:hypothetical protein